MSAHPHDSPEEQALWKANRRQRGSLCLKITPSHEYHPQPKAPSKVDEHRLQISLAKRIWGAIWPKKWVETCNLMK